MCQVYVQCWLIIGRAVAASVSWLTSVLHQPRKNLSLLRIALHTLHFQIISGTVLRIKHFHGFLKALFFIHQLRLISVKFFFQGYANVYRLKGCIGTSVFKSLTLLSVTYLLIFNIFEQQNKHQDINLGNGTSEYQSYLAMHIVWHTYLGILINTQIVGRRKFRITWIKQQWNF